MKEKTRAQIAREAKLMMKSKEEQLQDALIAYPQLAEKPKLKYSPTQIIKYVKAVKKYPDLKELPLKLVIIAYNFREELLRDYNTWHTSALADARCNPQLNKPCSRNYNIPDDLPALNFEKECGVCGKQEECINFCPDCWRLIRKCLDLKGESYRDGWEGWGNEMNLDLSGLVRLLRSDKEGKKMLEEVQKQKKSEGG